MKPAPKEPETDEGQDGELQGAERTRSGGKREGEGWRDPASGFAAGFSQDFALERHFLLAEPMPLCYTYTVPSHTDMRTHLHKATRRGFTLIELMVVIAILMSLMGISAYVILSHKNDGDIAKTKSNIKQLGTALDEFKDKNGGYPSDKTAESIEEKMRDEGHGDLTGDDSNAYLRQLFASRKAPLEDEKLFYAYTTMGICTEVESTKLGPDETLKAGENGFSYVLYVDGSERKPVIKGEALLIASTGDGKINSGDKVLFDAESYKGEAVVYRAGNGNVDTLTLSADPNDKAIGEVDDPASLFPGKRKREPKDFIVLPPLEG